MVGEAGEISGPRRGGSRAKVARPLQEKARASKKEKARARARIRLHGKGVKTHPLVTSDMATTPPTFERYHGFAVKKRRQFRLVVVACRQQLQV